jgi:hypothetical protein
LGLNVERIERRGRIEEARLGFLKAPLITCINKTLNYGYKWNKNFVAL